MSNFTRKFREKKPKRPRAPNIAPGFLARAEQDGIACCACLHDGETLLSFVAGCARDWNLTEGTTEDLIARGDVFLNGYPCVVGNTPLKPGAVIGVRPTIENGLESYIHITDRADLHDVGREVLHLRHRRPAS